MSYKRKLVEKTINFYAPDKECYACYDSGIVNNSDRLINRLYWHDYDIDEKGRKFTGSDAAIICHCKKAYQELDEDQNVISSGFRDSLGNIKKLITSTGEHTLGVSLTKDETRVLHNKRKESWQESVKIMNDYRLQKIKNPKTELPYFIQTVKETLENTPNLFSFPTEKATVESMKSIKSESPPS
tara:strand:+ start:97 stop:651 length:555 start_codon:yes stop_codon:yes gene_type:complete